MNEDRMTPRNERAVGEAATTARSVAMSPEHSRAILDAAFASSQDAIVIFRASDELIVDVNDAWCRVTGYARDQVLGRSQRTLDIWRNADDSIRLGEHIARHGGVDGFEFAFTRRRDDGGTELGYAVLSAQSVVLGDETYVVGVGHDVTIERREREARERARRLEELGRLAGGIAHDFNNILTVIASYAELLQAGVMSGTACLDDATQISRAAEAAAALTRRLLAFSRHQPTIPRQVDLSALIDESRRLLVPLAGERATVSFELAAGLPLVLADPGQLEQVLLNLVVNARDAIGDGPAGGRIAIRTGSQTLDAAEAWRILGAEGQAGRYVTLAVADTGCGMDEPTLARIFEPFFTTKASAGGTGLGLAVVHGIVRQAGGAAAAESAPGHGTTITIYWPESTNDAAVADPGPVRPTWGGAARILVVDDQLSIRTVVRRVLEQAGYEVYEAGDGVAALDLIDSTGQSFDLVLSDAVMPRMDGLGLAESLRALHPDIPVLLMSGYVDASSAELSELRNVIPVLLTKPFTSAELVAAVSSALRRLAKT